MTGVTHGADAERLLEVVDGLRGQGERVREIGDALMPLAGVLQESWGGQDCEALVADVQELRPGVASIGATLLAWADVLRGQAEQQTKASDGPGAAERRGPSGGSERSRRSQEAMDDVRDLADRIMGEGDRQDQGVRNPLLGALDPGSRPGRQGGGDASGVDPFDLLFGDKFPVYEGPKVSRSKSLGKGVSIEASGSATRDDAGLNDEGQQLETTTVTGKAEVSAEGGKRIGKAGLDVKGFAGTENTYSVTGVKGSNLTDANPFDPEGMPEGSRIRLSSEWYAGYELDAKYKNLVFEMGSTTGKEHYVEIIRGEGDLVTVRVGNQKFDEAMGATGLGLGPASVTLDNGGTTYSGTANEVTFDLSTQEGQDAYDQFVLGGKVPPADATGVVDVAKVEAFGGSKDVGVSARWGDKALSAAWVDNDIYGGATTTHADGTQTVAWSSRNGREGMDGEFTLDKSGDVVPGSQEVRARRVGVDASVVEDYSRLVHGSDANYSGNQNVVITYTHEDLQALREQAAEFTAQELNANPGWRGPAFDDRQDWTAAEVLAQVDRDDAARGTLRGVVSNSEFVVGARTDKEIVRALAHDPIDVQQDIARDYRATGKEPAPIGKVTVHPSN